LEKAYAICSLVLPPQAVLKLDIDEYADIQIIDPHLKRRRKGDKLGILDVKVRTKAGKIVNNVIG